MSKAYTKDIRRSVKKGWKRFLSIVLIMALGVAMLIGLYAGCMDMYYSADQFFDQQGLFDIRILSTLGLTEEDVAALARVDGVRLAEGSYSETVYTEVGGVRKSAEMSVLSDKGVNTPYLLRGALPAKQGEAAVTQKYLDESGKTIGDTLTIEEKREKDNNDDAEGVQPETAVTENSADAGDPDSELDTDIEIDLEEEQAPTFANHTYVITGVVTSPLDIQSDGGGSVFRTALAADYTFFITAADAGHDIFTAVHITLDGTQQLNSFSDEYENMVQAVVRQVEGRIKAQREQARYDAVLREARTKIQDAEATMDEKFAEADEKFADAWREIAEARQELIDGEATLIQEEKDAREKIAEARDKLERGKRELRDGEKQLREGKAQLAEGEAELIRSKAELEEGERQLVEGEAQLEQKAQELAGARAQLNAEQEQLDAARIQLEGSIDPLRSSLGDAWPEAEWNDLVAAAAALAAGGADDDAIGAGTAPEMAALASRLPAGMPPEQVDAVVKAALGLGKLNGGQLQLDGAGAALAEGEAQMSAARQVLTEKRQQLEAGKAQWAQGWAKLEEGKAELAEGRAALNEGKAELAKGEATLKEEEADANAKIADAWEEIAEGKQELADGEAELLEKEQEYAEKKQDARKKLDDAYGELDDIDMTQWYVQDRTSLDSYSSLNSDLSSIETIGKVFPVLFLLVAVLVSLTTMTRMVEEERGLIGVYQALGYGNAAIYSKYILFALIACLLGGMLGDLFGFVFMPKFIAVILEELYSLPQFYLRFDVLYGVGGVLLFMAAIVGSTVLACRNELVQMPAALMRPKAPREGTRVLLERIPGIWNRLNFLNKVTVRNLFRYKKRLLMTVGGIAGCTALILCGFAIKDSVADLGPKQYEQIYRYDLMAVFEQDDNDALMEQLTAGGGVQNALNLRIDSVKLINTGGEAEKVQLMVIPNGADLEDYIRTEGLGGELIPLDDNGVLVTQNAVRILGLKPGDTASIQNLELEQRDVALSGVVKNYLGNNVFMTQHLYETLFGRYVPNGVLAQLDRSCTDHAAYAQALGDHDAVLTAVSTAALQEDFGFDLINEVVLLLIVMAGGLAFVVLFTLSNTNISERTRELATIKVLGFYDHEVHQYVNKETLILAIFGILIGLPVGRILSGFLTAALNMPSIHFAVRVEPASYLISAAISFCFTVAVNWMTNPTLNRINMVEALKSVD